MTTDRRTTAAPVARLVDEFHRLPGIGPKTAQRLAYYLIRMPEEQARSLAEAVLAVKEQVVLCSRCYNITEVDPCAICGDPARDRATLCVVEEPLDAVALERTDTYQGLYHVLHGVISPMNGIGPDQLKIQPLMERLRAGQVREVILATNPNLEGRGDSHVHQPPGCAAGPLRHPAGAGTARGRRPRIRRRSDPWPSHRGPPTVLGSHLHRRSMASDEAPDHV